MLLNRVVEASAEIGATRSRKTKAQLIAAVLAAAVDGHEAALAASYLSGDSGLRRTGIGGRSLQQLPEPADEPSLTLLDVRESLTACSQVSGSGSAAKRASLVNDLFSRATAAEQQFLALLIIGELRQGALDAVMLEGLAQAYDVPIAAVRRAAMLGGSSPEVAAAAREEGEAGLARFTLRVGVGVSPMLAGSEPDTDAAVEGFADGEEFAVDAKLDGIRIQVHRSGDQVRIFTRSLDEITERLPGVVAAVLSFEADQLILDGEALAVDPNGRPMPFQVSAASAATHHADSPQTDSRRGGSATERQGLRGFFFDLLHIDGRDLIDEPARVRLAELDKVAGEHVVPRLVTASAPAAKEFFDELVAAGQEGVVIKSLDAPYAAGRRGAGWIKVKPRHTLDLVVLGVEWGSGRRRGYLSNIHLGARAGEGFVMLGKTFKGMTDEMLTWQTQRFLELEESREGHVVWLRPEQVVEIAIDGLQRSVRYPGGVALRFARVLRYREDKTAVEADTLENVLKLAP